MSYDYQGNRLQGYDEVGYTMQTEPSWTQGKCILTDHSTIATGTVYDASSSLKASDFVPVRGRNSLIIMFPVVSDTTPPDYGLCFYDRNKIALPNYGTNVCYGRTSSDELAKTVEVYIPKNAEFFRTTYWSDSAIQSNSGTPAFTYSFTPGIYAGITHEIPANRWMENAIRRTRQLTDLEWEPLVRVPRYSMMNGSDVHFLDWCEAGKTYKGIPYSGSGHVDGWYGRDDIDPNSLAGSWGYLQLHVGNEISIDTFVTAARYENSIFGERADQTSVSYDASPYGAVCVSLVSYSLGLPMPILPVNGFTNTANYNSTYYAVTADNMQKIRLCDVLEGPGHVTIITDIIRNDAGNVVEVEMSEATTIGNANNSLNDGTSKLGGICRRKRWKLSDFVSSYASYSFHRPKCLPDLGYTPSNYVDTGGEGDKKRLIDYPCIPYLGNRARYKAGYLPNTKVLIGATGFTNLVVTKDGNAFGTFAINGATEIEVGFSAVGSYSAHLEKSGATTMSCHWTVE